MRLCTRFPCSPQIFNMYYRSGITRSLRLFATTPAARKTAAEKVKEAGDTVNKKLGQTLAAGIEKGEHATEKVKKTVGMKSEQAKESAQEAKQTAEHKAGQMAAGAHKAKEDIEKESRK